MSAGRCSGVTAAGRPCRNRVGQVSAWCGRCAGRPDGFPPSRTQTSRQTAASAATDPLAVGTLSDVDLARLDFERDWWTVADTRDEALAVRGWTAADHEQELDRILSTDAAVTHDPMLVKRLRRKRARRGVPAPSEPDPLLPAELADYYAATEAKHFGAAATGSRFTSHESLAGVLAQARAEHGDLSDMAAVDRADRAARSALARAGTSPDAFLPNCRYVQVRGVTGELGIVPASRLANDQVLTAVVTKPGVPAALVVDGVDKPTVDYATVVLGPPPSGSGVHEDLVVWTAHPGPPVRPAESDAFAHGDQVTVAQALRHFNGDVFVQVH